MEMISRPSIESFITTLNEVLEEQRDLTPVQLQKIRLNPEVRFKEDLGLSSLAMIALFCELQTKYPHLSEDSLMGWKTISDCYQNVAES